MKRPETRKWYKIWMKSALLALVCSVSLFLVMVRMEKAALSGYEKTTVWVAAKEIPRGLMLETELWEEYLEQRQVDGAIVPDRVITGAEELAERMAAYSIEPGTILTLGMFENHQEILAQMEQPVVAGFKVDDLYQLVGGVLRPGDRIHIYALNEEGKVATAWENMYVQQAFDSNGNSVGADDRNTAVSRINIYIEKGNVEEFYAGLAGGSLRVVKMYR